MSDSEPRYSFDPLERRGVLLGLQPAQLVTIGVAAVTAFAASRALAGHGGRAVGALLFVAGVGTTLWTRDGRPVSAWLVDGASWFAHRSRGPLLDDRPLEGVTRATRRSRVAATRPPGIELAALTSQACAPIGVVLDRRHGRWMAAVPVKGRSFSLLDPADQARRLDGWRVALNSLGRPGTAVRRVQWIERSFPEPAGGACVGAPAAVSAPAARGAATSYRDLVARAKPAQLHDAYVIVAIDGAPDLESASGRKAEQVLRREMRLLEGQLRNADLLPSRPLDLEGLVQTIAATYEERRSRAIGCGWPWPMAQDEQWSYVRSGGLWHATYWIAEWPRIEVSPDFLTPLLMCEGRRTVSLVMEPVPPDRAAREARSARTADAADEQLRSRAGFLPSARRGREAEGVMRREAELAEGHAEFRFSGYVSVHADGEELLDAACAEVEHAAQAAHVELRRLVGRQGEALTWTLPLARGLR